jgi:predicted DNA-binding transcriptional regulator YafY
MDITKRFDRILQIFFLLQSKFIVSTEDLKTRFDISERTIYRDLKALEQAGVPIVNESGSGYSIMEGFRLQPSRFSQEEILSLMVAQKVMEKHETQFVKKNFEAALIKIKSSFQVHQKQDFLNLEDKLHFKVNFQSNDYLPNIIETILNGTLKKKITTISYLKSGDANAVSRNLEPIGVLHENGAWYLYAFCHLRKDYRNFRLDRIKRIAVLDEDFTMEHLSINEFKSINQTGTVTRIAVSVDKKYAQFLFWERQSFGFVAESIGTDTVVMHFDCPLHPTSFVRWFMKFVDVGEIQEPVYLQNELAEILNSGLKRIKDQH